MFDLSRRNLFLGTMAGLPLGKAAAQTPVATPAQNEIATCGVNYDLGAELYPGVLTRPAEHQHYFRDELTTIRDELKSQSVSLYGSDLDQMTAGLDIAADLGFDIKFQSRLNYLKQPEMVERLVPIAKEAERVRQNGTPIVLDVGCEYVIFAEGMIDGVDIFEKMETINAGNVDWTSVMAQMAELLAALADTAREHFGGAITYSDTPDMDFAWDSFDIVGLDHYFSSDNETNYIDLINAAASNGKPVWINEFGACPWRGAYGAGGMAWDIVDYTVEPPQIEEGIVRSEEEQARVLLATLDRIDESVASRRYVYQFIEPGAPRSADPRYDLDLNGYGIVSCWDDQHEQPYETTGYWEPKIAFGELAKWNADRT